jgi:hypothetical protein
MSIDYNENTMNLSYNFALLLVVLEMYFHRLSFICKQEKGYVCVMQSSNDQKLSCFPIDIDLIQMNLCNTSRKDRPFFRNYRKTAKVWRLRFFRGRASKCNGCVR